MNEQPQYIDWKFRSDAHTVEQALPKREFMIPTHRFFQAFLHNQTFIEGGDEGAAEIQDFSADGGTYLIVMTHFDQWSPTRMANATEEPAISHFELNTEVLAKEELGQKFLLKYFFNNVGLIYVKRPPIGIDEDPHSKEYRNKYNIAAAKTGALALSNKANLLVFGEGMSKEILLGPDGKPIMKGDKVVRVPRKRGVVLQVKNGVGYILHELPDEQLEKTKIIGIGENIPSKWNPLAATLFVTKPQEICPPVADRDENVANRVAQVQDILEYAVENADRIGNLRRLKQPIPEERGTYKKAA